MNEQIEKVKKKYGLKLYLVIAAVIVIALLVVWVATGLSSRFSTDGKITKLGFENIGELATQSAVSTSVRVISKERNVLGIPIPFTESKAIYSYDTSIKAGINFSDVKWNLDETNKESKKIYVEIPEIKVLSVEIIPNSFKVYHEENNIFSPISIKEHNDSLEELELSAKENAIENGLFDAALENAKQLLKVFFAQGYDPNSYTIIFSK